MELQLAEQTEEQNSRPSNTDQKKVEAALEKKRAKEANDRKVDVASEDSFPASDSPSFTPFTGH